MTLIGITTLLLAVAGTLAGTGPDKGVRRLADFPRQPTEIREWMKQHDWKSKRNSPRDFELADGQLHLVSRDDSVLIGTRKGLALDPQEWPLLRFRLRVDENPRGMDLTRKSGDDAAFRIYVAFDRGGGLFSPPNTIAYTWTEDLKPDSLVRSAHFKRLRYMSIGKGVTHEGSPAAAGTDAWVTIERDLVEDYRRAFPEERGPVPDFVGFMLKCDSNNTGTSASAWLSDLELVSPERRDG